MWQKEEAFKDDSIINFAIKYYEQHKDPKRLANAYHYKSGILYIKGRKKQAIALEKKAELIAKNLIQDDSKTDAIKLKEFCKNNFILQQRR